MSQTLGEVATITGDGDVVTERFGTLINMKRPILTSINITKRCFLRIVYMVRRGDEKKSVDLQGLTPDEKKELVSLKDLTPEEEKELQQLKRADEEEQRKREEGEQRKREKGEQRKRTVGTFALCAVLSALLAAGVMAGPHFE